MNFTESTKKAFNAVADHLLQSLQTGEEANLNLHAEDTTFIRFNNNKVRQNTHVEQRSLGLLLQKNGKTANLSFSITGQVEEDKKRADHWLAEARKECDLLPEDPYQVALQNNGTSDSTITGHLLSEGELFKAITEPAQGSDLAGLYCAGALISANKNSKGQSHWFANESFFMDYSLYLGEKAVKGVYAGTAWNQADFAANLAQSKNQLALMDRPKKTLPPGAYRAYLAPGAVAELASMFYWGALSFNGYKQGTSAFMKLADKEKTLSPLFSMQENYKMGLIHQFNSLGELSPETLPLVSEGKLANFLISTRSAKEYSVTGNAADSSEAPRSLEILPGTLQKADILKELGTGLYLSNLHYLNWSDRMNARITGMTRYACFWVENGEIVAPIADMRFDESLFDCLGQNLVAVTDFQEVDPQVSTYESRSFGGKKIPGMLIKDFKFTL
ncbi:TldD/PmbA family protein [Bdellovibrio svalbardensis]|uniref:Metallopeptidase TldD-related protein n=1 Tax=Bdellovibrio svalbardensis TaxID=2972972 RepID=A0ABT6DJ16_9BACT|nr:metallopeptidase TldD-related protein [Bdellovibrio svalbardensis]MDG0816850.1 metallopeptidase TldD-related protein [Bdellovibrio svalbardensis]